MPHTITCPTPDCGRQLRVPDTLVGKKVKCPSCGNTFVAQVDEIPPPPSEEEEREQQEEETPVRRSAAREDDGDEEEDDRDDRPRKRRKRRGHVKEHRGQLILILGILSFFIAPLILGPIAWIMGNADMQEIRAGRMDREGEGSTNAGRICGMISTIVSGVCIGGICLFYFVIVMIAVVSNPH